MRQGDKGDNHSDDYVYMPLRRGDESRGGAASGSGGYARCKARHRAASASATVSSSSEAAAAAGRVFYDELTPAKCGLGGGGGGGGFGHDDLLAVTTRSKSKTPVRAGAMRYNYVGCYSGSSRVILPSLVVTVALSNLL